MKILFFIESLRSGGKERRLVELLKYLSKNGLFEIKLVLTRKEIDYQDIFNLGFTIQIIERGSLKKNPRLFFSFLKIAKKFNPDVIHVWGNMAALYATPTKIILNLPMINNQITDAFENVPGGILSHKTTFRFSNLIIANSFAGLKAYNSPLPKSKVIYNGFDFNRIKNLKSSYFIKEKFDIQTKFIVGMVASFSDLKDYETYIKAANILLSENLDITFLCVGKGNDSIYRSLVESRWQKQVKFLGLQSDVESIMNCCDVGVLSTYTEGISNTILEFMALGKPVVATRGGGTEELVLDKETGYLVNQKSPKEMADKIKILIENPDLSKTMGEKGKKRIETHFLLSTMAEQFVNIYKEIGTS